MIRFLYSTLWSSSDPNKSCCGPVLLLQSSLEKLPQVLLAFVFPSIFVIRLSTDPSYKSRVVPYVILVLGLFLSVATTTIQILHQREMTYGKNVSVTDSNPALFYYPKRAMQSGSRGPWLRKVSDSTGVRTVECDFWQEKTVTQLQKVLLYSDLRDAFVKDGATQKRTDIIKSASWAAREGCVSKVFVGNVGRSDRVVGDFGSVDNSPEEDGRGGVEV